VEFIHFVNGEIIYTYCFVDGSISPAILIQSLLGKDWIHKNEGGKSNGLQPN